MVEVEEPVDGRLIHARIRRLERFMTGLRRLMKLVDLIENMDPETLEYLSDTLHYAHERAGLEVLGLRSKLEELKRRKRGLSYG